MIALYRPGTSLLHRAPAWSKLAGLMLIAIVIAASLHDPRPTVLLGGLTLLLYALAGFGPGELGRQLWTARWLIVFVGAAQIAFVPWTQALLGCARVAVLIAVAALVTLTTRTGDMLVTITSALSPLRRVGAEPDRIALTLSLTIAAVPTVARIVSCVREARSARGSRVGVRAWLTPVLVLTLKYADDLGDALTARGVE